MTPAPDPPRHRAEPVVLCPFCLEHHGEADEVCRRCHAPLKGWALHELLGQSGPDYDAEAGANEPPPTLAALIGMWVLWGPVAAWAAGSFMWILGWGIPWAWDLFGAADVFGVLLALALSGSIAWVSGSALIRGTRNYVTGQRKRQRGFAPIMAPRPPDAPPD